MDAGKVLEQARTLGITLTRTGDRIRYAPKSKTPHDFVEQLRRHKTEVLDLLSRAADCRNPHTLHATHAFPWECDPDSCYCFQEFGHPHLCEGVACRWIWPDGAPPKVADQ